METCTDSNLKQKSDKRFPFLFTLFRIGGLPLETKKAFLLQRVYNLIITFSSFSVYASIIADALSHKPTEDPKGSLESVRIAFLMVMHIWAEIIIRMKKASMDRLFLQIGNFTWEEMPETDIDTGELTIVGWMPRIQKFIKISMNTALIVYLIQSLRIVFIARELILPGLYPFDAFVSPNYEIVFLTQVLALPRMLSLLYGIPYLYTVLVCVACTQLLKIRMLLQNIKQKHEIGITTSAEEGIRIENELNSCIMLHQQLLSYLAAIEDATSIMLCGIFFFLLLTSCVTAFSAATNLEDIGDVGQCFALYASSMIVTSIYCIFGSMLAQEYDEVKNAAWSSDWVGTPVSYQRSIAFIMAMSSKGFYLTAGKFVPVSNTTLLNMINESMSLFMFLLTMKDKSDD